MTNPINLVLSSQLAEFNKIFATAHDKNLNERSKMGQQLVKLKDEMDLTALSATAFPERIKNSKELSQMLAAKISCLFDKDVKGKPSSGPSQPAPSSSTQYVGFHNKSANCWANALLQKLFHTEEGMEIVRTIGEYYASGKDFDTQQVSTFIKYCSPMDFPIDDEQVVQYFCAIQSGYQRLSALEILCRSKADPALIKHLTKFLPQLEQERLAKLKTNGDLDTALNLLLADNEKAEKNRLLESRKHGQYLLDALIVYNQTILSAEMNKTTPKPIPDAVSQNVRLAFHHFFGMSASATTHEDAHEGLQNLMGRYQDILKSQGAFPPKTYSQTETRTRYVPVGQPRPLTGPRSQLEPDNILRKSSFDYQILVDAGKISGVCVENLLDSHFQDPPFSTPDDYPVFLAEDRVQEQSYRPVEQQRQFVDGAPKTFTLVIKRSSLGNNRRPIKLATHVIANQVITLPACAFPTDKRERAYALTSFFVHRGTSGFGHYIAYRKIGEQWVEFDDETVRKVSNAEINRILQGRERATPYALDYRLVPEEHQKEMLIFSKELRQGPTLPQPIPLTSSSSQKVPVKSSLSPHQIMIGLLSELLISLKKPTCGEEEIARAFAAMQEISPICIKQLTSLLEIQDGVKATDQVPFLCKNAKKLITPTTSWIRTTSDSILEQYIQREREKMSIVACRAEIANMEDTQRILPKDFRLDMDFVVKKKQEEQNLTKQYRIANLRALFALLKNPSLSVVQLKAIFGEFDLPAAIKNQMYIQISEAMGAKKVEALAQGQRYFQENPRLLILPMNTTNGKLSMDNGSSGHPTTTIIEETIATL